MCKWKWKLTRVLLPRGPQALAKYAFGLGTVTMVACTLVFTGMSLPPGQGLGTQIMVKVSPLSPGSASPEGEGPHMCKTPLLKDPPCCHCL